MEGDIETRPLTHRDHPTERVLTLLGPIGRNYGPEEQSAVEERFEELQTAEPEVIRSTTVQVDREAGRLAVGLLVYGDHIQLQKRASEWLGALRFDDPDALGYAWRIDH